jgi:hypothetical protein
MLRNNVSFLRFIVRFKELHVGALRWFNIEYAYSYDSIDVHAFYGAYDGVSRAGALNDC